MNYNGPVTMDERLFIHCYYYTQFSANEIATYLQIPLNRVKNYLKTNNMRLTKDQRRAKQSLRMQIEYNSAEFDGFIRENYLTITKNEIARLINKSDTFVDNRIKFLGLIIPKEILQQRIKNSYLKKGSIPPNKGKKLSAEIRAKLEPTFFKKGHKPHNEVPIGTERITDDGYIEVKVVGTPNVKNWKLKHRIVWQQHNGLIPKGYNVQFKDGNRQNVSINNLFIISRKEQLIQNGHSPVAIAKRVLKMTDEDIEFAKINNPGLIEAKAAQMKLKSLINKQLKK